MQHTATEHFRTYQPQPSTRAERDRVTILFGGLHWRAERLIQGAMENLGYRSRILPTATKEDLLAGCVIEIYPAILILAPLVTHLGKAFGLDPVHLGIIFLANMELGYLTPLVGLNLFFASYRFGKPVVEVFRAVLPLFVALGAGVLAITYLPWLSSGLPGLVR